MRNFHTASKIALFSGAALCAAGIAMAPASQARADDCLLDTNNDGVADAGDTDGGAISVGTDTLACGVAAVAGAAGSTAIESRPIRRISWRRRRANSSRATRALAAQCNAAGEAAGRERAAASSSNSNCTPTRTNSTSSA